MKAIVSWKDIEGMEGIEVEVEGEDRWDIVVEASRKLGLDKIVPMQVLFDTASVRKAGGPKRSREWRFGDGKPVIKEVRED